MLSCQVIVPSNSIYSGLILPCNWAICNATNGLLDVFVVTEEPVKAHEYVNVVPIAFCRVSENGSQSDVLLAFPKNVAPSLEEIKQFEARAAQFLHRAFSILKWGNAEETKNLLATRYNITT